MTSRPAILLCDVQGKFSTWLKGERVLATGGNGVFHIERADKKDRTTLNNVMTGVPESALQFEAQAVPYKPSGKPSALDPTRPRIDWTDDDHEYEKGRERQDAEDGR